MFFVVNHQTPYTKIICPTHLLYLKISKKDSHPYIYLQFIRIFVP